MLGALFAGGNGFLNGAILGSVFGLVAGFATPNTRLSPIYWFTRGLSRHADQREEDKYER